MDDVLRQGIAAAKAGQRERARDLLMRVVEQEKENALAWLWLSGVVDSLDDREVCLENVLSIDPDNALAHKGLGLLHQQKADRLMREGVAAAKAGQRERARELLMQVVEYDEKNVPAWLWLSDVVDDLGERQICLENVLSIDPHNASAHRGLAAVREQKGREQPPPAAVTESPLVARAETPVTPAAAILHQDFASRRPPPGPDLSEPPTPVRDEFDDEYLCPYCAAPTEPQDRRCPACGGDLWVKFRLLEERSIWLWSTLTLPISGALQSGVGLVLLLTYAYLAHSVTTSSAGSSVQFALRLVGAALQTKSEPFTLLPLYFGLPNNVPPDVANAALEALPRPVFLLFALPFVFSLLIFIGLYQRWKPVFYLYLVSAALGLIVAVAGMILSPGLNLVFAGLFFIALIAATMLLSAFKIKDDFTWKKERILLRVDRGLSNAVDFMVRGDFYARRNMWAMTAIHLRRAAAFLPNDPSCQITLAAAYVRLRRTDRAAQILEQVRGIVPNDPRVAQLQALLDEMRSAEPVSQSGVKQPSV
jgi:Flp pilus assembly protein TadD